MKISTKARNAILIGSMCAISYLAVDIARNVLSAASAKMDTAGVLNDDILGTLTSVYFFTYAIGQLINGVIGDKIKAKYMIGVGLAMAGVTNLVFTATATIPFASYIAYGATGFFLAMIYGPMTKLVAENTEPIYATRCSLGYTFSSLLGSPLAGILATLLAWQGVFYVSSAVLIVMAIVCFSVFHALERRKIIQYGKYDAAKTKGSIRVLIKHQIIKFTLVSILTGVIRTTLASWMTKYFSDFLGFSDENASLAFTIGSLVISISSFFIIFVYERLRHNMDLTLLLSFIAAAVSFTITWLVAEQTTNIIFMIGGIFFANCAATMLWSRYCPGLRDTGMVSSATGFLDFVSYMAAAISTRLFPVILGLVNWPGLLCVMAILMLIGVIVSLPYHKMKKTA